MLGAQSLTLELSLALTQHAPPPHEEGGARTVRNAQSDGSPERLPKTNTRAKRLRREPTPARTTPLETPPRNRSAPTSADRHR